MNDWPLAVYSAAAALLVVGVAAYTTPWSLLILVPAAALAADPALAAIAAAVDRFRR